MAQISSYLLLTGKLLHNRLANLWNPKINYISSQIALTNRCNASCPINAVNIWIIFIWWIYRKTSKTDSEFIFFWIFFNKFQVKYKKSHFFLSAGIWNVASLRMVCRNQPPQAEDKIRLEQGVELANHAADSEQTHCRGTARGQQTTFMIVMFQMWCAGQGSTVGTQTKEWGFAHRFSLTRKIRTKELIPNYQNTGW